MSQPEQPLWFSDLDLGDSHAFTTQTSNFLTIDVHDRQSVIGIVCVGRFLSGRENR